MKTKIYLKGILKKAISIILLISGMALVSCSDKVFPSDTKSDGRTQYLQSLKRSIYGSQNTLSPYTEQHKTYLQKKYFGRDLKRELKSN
jgi:hypothetical protein